jgi:hypothetical protein
MALIRLDKNTLHLDVLVGIEESYEPNKAIKDLNKKVNEFKESTFKFLEDNFGTKNVEEINSILDKKEEKKEIWIKYLQEEYAPKYNEFSAKLEEINKKICPNYEEYFKA